MLGKDLDAISKVDRQTGKIGELSAGFGGSVGAWRRQIADDRSDVAIKADIEKWRRAHPRVVKFWHDLARCIRIAMKTGQSVYVGTPPGPTITANFEAGNLYLTLPIGRAITYPEARLVPSKFEGYPADVMFKDNARRQWKETRGLARNLHRERGAGYRARHPGGGDRADGGARPARGPACPRRSGDRNSDRRRHARRIPTARIGAGALGGGLPLAGKARVAHCYLEEPEEPLQPQPDSEAAVVETVLDSYLDDARAIVVQPQAPTRKTSTMQREDDDAFLDDLDPNSAPLRDFVSLPLTDDNKVSCPFHDDPTPSLQIYPDHWHCLAAVNTAIASTGWRGSKA